MRHPLGLAVLAILIAYGGFASVVAEAQIVPQMTPALIEEAIKVGATGKGEGCYGLRSMEPIGIMGCISTPFSRVVGAADEARQKYKTFTPADVTPAMITPEIRVHAFANTYATKSVVSVENVILRPKGAKGMDGVTRPLKMEESEGTYKNAMGGEWTGKSMVATFPIDALTDDTEVHVIYARPLCRDGTDCRARLIEPLRKLR